MHERIKQAQDNYDSFDGEAYSDALQTGIVNHVDKFVAQGLPDDATSGLVDALKRFATRLPLDWRIHVDNISTELEQQQSAKDARRDKIAKENTTSGDFLKCSENMLKLAEPTGKGDFGAAARIKGHLDGKVRQCRDAFVRDISNPSYAITAVLIADQMPQIYHRFNIHHSNVTAAENNFLECKMAPWHYTYTSEKKAAWYKHSRWYGCFLHDAVSLSWNAVVDALFSKVKDAAAAMCQALAKGEVPLDIVKFFTAFLALATDNPDTSCAWYLNTHVGYAAVRASIAAAFEPLAALLGDVHKAVGVANDEQQFTALAAGLGRLKHHDKAIAAVAALAKLDPHLLAGVDGLDECLTSYDQQCQRVADALCKLRDEVFVSLKGNEKLMTENSLDRDAFYKQFNTNFERLCALPSVQMHVDLAKVFAVVPVDAACEKLMCSEIEDLAASCTRDGLLQEGQVDAAARLSKCYDNFRSAVDHCESSENMQAAARDAMETVDDGINTLLVAKMTEFRVTTDSQERAEILIRLKEFAVHTPSFSSNATTVINDNCLGWLFKERGGGDGIATVGSMLKKHDCQSIALRLIEDHAAFRSLKVLIRNQKMLQFSPEDVLNGITVDGKMPLAEQCKATLREHYAKFDEEYWGLVEDSLDENADLNGELTKLTLDAKKLAVAARQNDYPDNLESIRGIMCRLFAYWTINSADSTFSKSSEDARQSLMQPHAAQVLSIFRLFGFDDGQS